MGNMAIFNLCVKKSRVKKKSVKNLVSFHRLILDKKNGFMFSVNKILYITISMNIRRVPWNFIGGLRGRLLEKKGTTSRRVQKSPAGKIFLGVKIHTLTETAFAR